VTTEKEAEVVLQKTEHLPSKRKALSSNPSTTRRKKKKKTQTNKAIKITRAGAMTKMIYAMSGRQMSIIV
jgi:hypothetical protein